MGQTVEGGEKDALHHAESSNAPRPVMCLYLVGGPGSAQVCSSFTNLFQRKVKSQANILEKFLAQLWTLFLKNKSQTTHTQSD